MSSQLVAQWVSAVGSAGSLLGFAAYVIIMLLNRKDQAEVRQEQQAQGVAAWLDEGSAQDRDEDYVLCVHNGGDIPVFNVSCLFSLPSSTDQHNVGLSLVPPTATAVRALPFDPSGVDREELYSAPAVPEMRFTDSHGTNWQRDSSGQLIRLDPRPGLRRKPGSRSGQASGSQGSDDRDDQQWEQDHAERTGDTSTRRH